MCKLTGSCIYLHTPTCAYVPCKQTYTHIMHTSQSGIPAYIHTHLHTRPDTDNIYTVHMHACMHAYMCTYNHTHTHSTCVYICIHTADTVYACIQHMYKHAHTHTQCVCLYIHTSRYLYIPSSPHNLKSACAEIYMANTTLV